MSKRKWREPAEQKDDDVTFDSTRRQLSTQPRHLTAALCDPVLGPLFDHAARQIQLLTYWGSQFLNFHLLRLLWDEEKNDFPEKIDKAYISKCFMVVAAYFPDKRKLGNKKEPHRDDRAILKSAELWELESKQPEKMKAYLPGMSGMVESAVRDYSEAFDNYQIYGLCQHWVYVVRLTYEDATQKISEMVVRKLCEFIKETSTVTCRSAGHFLI
jgi:hypothetical protein